MTICSNNYQLNTLKSSCKMRKGQDPVVEFKLSFVFVYIRLKYIQTLCHILLKSNDYHTDYLILRKQKIKNKRITLLNLFVHLRNHEKDIILSEYCLSNIYPKFFWRSG